MIAEREDRAAERGAAREAVDPRHRVPVVGVVLEHARHHGVEVAAPLGVRAHERRLDRKEPQGEVGDHAGEAERAGGAPEQLGIGSGRDFDHLLRRVQRERLDVVGEAAVDVVVLAVHVGGERAADGHEPRARRDGHEEAERERGADERVDAHARVDPRNAGVGVDVELVVEGAAVEHGAARVLRRVAVAAPEAPVRSARAARCARAARRHRARRRGRRRAPRSERCGPSR